MTIKKTDYPVHNLIASRWSSRALSGEQITEQELLPLFEAARFAPSSYNGQPWRFLYALSTDPEWPLFFNLLVPFNQEWVKNAGALILILSRCAFESNGKPSRTHSFDTGAAWMSLSLEGVSKGYIVHGMEGFDYNKAKETFAIPDDYQIEAMAAIGKPGSKELLSKSLQEKEVPSPRKPLKDIVFRGSWHKI